MPQITLRLRTSFRPPPAPQVCKNTHIHIFIYVCVRIHINGEKAPLTVQAAQCNHQNVHSVPAQAKNIPRCKPVPPHTSIVIAVVYPTVRWCPRRLCWGYNCKSCCVCAGSHIPKLASERRTWREGPRSPPGRRRKACASIKKRGFRSHR